MEANAGCQEEYHAIRQHNVGKWSFNPLYKDVKASQDLFVVCVYLC